MLGEKLKKGKKLGGENSEEKRAYVFKQKLTEEEILKKKQAKLKKEKKFLDSIEKRKKRKQKLNKNNANKTDDFITSVFVGAEK